MFESLPVEVPSIAVALGCGLLIGIEREQHKADHAGRMAAGVRTLALVALAGAVAALLGSIAIGVTGAFIALATVVGYWRTRDAEPGLTTEVAIVLTFLIGMLAIPSPALAAGTAVVVTIILQSKGVLHRFSRSILSEQELNDGLLLLASALVVLPILPDVPIGPFEGLNLKRLWTLVVLVMAINALGYVAVRTAGPRFGLPLTGLVGGFVSSAATIASMGHRAQADPSVLRAAAAGGMASNLATMTMLVAITVAVDRDVLAGLALPLMLAFAVVGSASAWLGWRAWRAAAPADQGQSASRPFHFGHALSFAGLIALVLIVSDLLASVLGDMGATLGAAAVGFADAHAPAVSLAELSAQNRIDSASAQLGILLALSSNTLTKIVVARSAGGPGYARYLVPSLLLMLVALWLGYAVQRW